MIRCRVARRFADAALERELGLEQRFLLDEHVARCLPCAEHERRARGLQELLEAPAEPPPPDVEGAVHAVFTTLERGEGRVWRPRRKRRMVELVALGAALAAAGVLAWFVHASVRPTVPRAPLAGTPAPAPAPAWTAERVEVEVRAAVLRCFGVAGADEERARTAFLERTRELGRSGWPVRRFVESLLEQPDAAVVLAASRSLAALGDPGSIPALERALARSGRTRGTLDEVFGALGTLGEPALPALERALGDPVLAPGALLQLCRIGGERATAVLERAARAARDDAAPSREALLDALTTTGPAAVESLLRLAAERASAGGAGARADSTAILARLALVRDGGAELARCLERGRPAGELAYRAALVLRPEEALPWLEERCAEHRERALALATLAEFPGEAPLRSVLHLAAAGRVGREDVLDLLGGLLERDGDRAEQLTIELVERAEAPPLHDWLALLIESEHVAAARALVPLVFCTTLGDDDRQWAALAVGELGAAADGERLLAHLGAPASEDRRLAAACMLSVHTLLGAPGVERWLESCSLRNVQRVLTALESGGAGEAVLVHRVARALEGAITELGTKDTDLL